MVAFAEQVNESLAAVSQSLDACLQQQLDLDQANRLFSDWRERALQVYAFEDRADSGVLKMIQVACSGTQYHNSVLTVSLNSQIKVYDVDRRECVRTEAVEGAKKVYCIEQMSERVLVTSGADNCIRVWEIPSFSVSQIISDCFETEVFQLKKFNEQLLLASPSSGDLQPHYIKMFDLKKAECVLSWATEHESFIFCLALDHGGHLFSGSADHTIKLWDQNQSESIQTYTGED